MELPVAVEHMVSAQAHVFMSRCTNGRGNAVRQRRQTLPRCGQGQKGVMYEGKCWCSPLLDTEAVVWKACLIGKQPAQPAFNRK